APDPADDATHRSPLPSTYVMRFSSAGDHDQNSPSYGSTPPSRSNRTRRLRRSTCFCCMPPISTASLTRRSSPPMPYIGSLASVDDSMRPSPVGLTRFDFLFQ